MNKYFLILITACSAAFLTLPQFALAQSVYKWTDENGRVHYGDRPPQNRQVEDITDSTKSVNIDTSGENTEAMSKIFAKETQAEKNIRLQQEAEARQQQQARESACTQLIERLDTIKNKRFIWENEDGTTATPKKDEVQREVERLEHQIRNQC